MLTEQSSGFEAAPAPCPSQALLRPICLALAPADPLADCEGMVVNVHAAGSRQEANASGEGSGFNMPDSRADGPRCLRTAPETGRNTLNNHRHQEAHDDMLEKTQMTSPTMSQTRCRGLPCGLPEWGPLCVHMGRAVV